MAKRNEMSEIKPTSLPTDPLLKEILNHVLEGRRKINPEAENGIRQEAHQKDDGKNTAVCQNLINHRHQ